MPKFNVEITVHKTYSKNYELTVYADSEADASDKAQERALDWQGNASDIDVEVLDVSEE